jgi:hypothetical protein
LGALRWIKPLDAGELLVQIVQRGFQTFLL